MRGQGSSRIRRSFGVGGWMRPPVDPLDAVFVHEGVHWYPLTASRTESRPDPVVVVEEPGILVVRARVRAKIVAHQGSAYALPQRPWRRSARLGGGCAAQGSRTRVVGSENLGVNLENMIPHDVLTP